jgi:hypothetical protein
LKKDSFKVPEKLSTEFPRVSVALCLVESQQFFEQKGQSLDVISLHKCNGITESDFMTIYSYVVGKGQKTLGLSHCKSSFLVKFDHLKNLSSVLLKPGTYVHFFSSFAIFWQKMTF